MKPHRDELGAAHERIEHLQARVAELEGKNVAPSPEKKGGGGAAVGLLGLPVMVLVIVGCIVLGGRACIACNASETDPALAALRGCPAAAEALGRDIGWSMAGCSNYESGAGGDPMNGGCHSSASYVMPVSGTKGRGSYSFSTSSPTRGAPTFDGGRVTLTDGRTIGINSNGTCQ